MSASLNRSQRPSSLDLRQQRILDEVIEAARRKACGGHVSVDRNRWSYWARHVGGRTHWNVLNALKLTVARGTCR